MRLVRSESLTRRLLPLGELPPTSVTDLGGGSSGIFFETFKMSEQTAQ